MTTDGRAQTVPGSSVFSAVREGDQFRDLDAREIKKGRWVEVESVSTDFAYCVSFPSQKGVRIHLSRLTNPRLFERVTDRAA